MLFRAAQYELIRKGRITVAFRCWRRPTVSPGGTLLTPAGQLSIDEVEPMELADITEADAQAAGASSIDELVSSLRCDPDRRLYRIRFHRLGDDPRAALRDDDDLDASAREAIGNRLAALDRHSRTGPWTAATLAAIAESPGTPSRLLAPRLAVDQPTFKRRVRRLKSLGLTDSLDVGYRLSPRGKRFLSETP